MIELNYPELLNRQKAFLGNVTLSIDMNQIRMIVLAESRQRIVLAEKKRGKMIRRYWSSACLSCPIKAQCTTGQYRRISRWEHETVLEVVDAILEQQPDMMKIRKSTVEHPFGTIKYWMGSTHFQMKTLKKVGAEMSLHVLAYNIKRVLKIMGAVPLMEAMMA
jgi:hypothetical protein